MAAMSTLSLQGDSKSGEDRQAKGTKVRQSQSERSLQPKIKGPGEASQLSRGLAKGPLETGLQDLLPKEGSSPVPTLPLTLLGWFSPQTSPPPSPGSPATSPWWWVPP